ncbi:MAG TPA: prepilin-type N-terminal cleavage/methylation domain-containing protein [Chthonomonadaceae bacterium]|nr:prepilin-type N-terminal cleavage/methylation domain-containing protein [Chthonomonadaceae bacterium]
MRIRRRGKERPGFTLLEVIVALVIFGVISFATGLALSVALRAHTASTQRQEDQEEASALFATLSRDLTAAYGSLNDPDSVFIAGGGQGPRAAGGSLLLLTTLSHRIEAEANPAGGAQDESAALPQSDCALVRYDLDANTGTLLRVENAVPNPQVVMQATPSPTNILSRRVLALNLRFWDANARAWRSDWDFEQPNQAAGQPTTQGSAPSGQEDANGTAPSGGTGQADSGTGDSALPGAVEVSLALRRTDGTPATYTTLIPIAAPQPMPHITAPAANTGAPANPNTTAPPGG